MLFSCVQSFNECVHNSIYDRLKDANIFIAILQVHIVKPVMTRLKVLTDATQTVIEGRK